VLASLFQVPLTSKVPSNRMNLRVCCFDCTYCQCGTTQVKTRNKQTAQEYSPPPADIASAIRFRFARHWQAEARPDIIMISGNGEPTLHPLFPEVVKEVVTLREEYFPRCPVGVLSNSATLDSDVLKALGLVDECVFKLDAADSSIFRQINRPTYGISLSSILERLSRAPCTALRTAVMNENVRSL